MKNIKFTNSKTATLLVLILITTIGCDRDISEEAELSGFPPNGEVFIDNFSAGLDYFPFGDSVFEAFSVDSETTFDGSPTAMRFDVPNVGDPAGAYAGAIFRTASARDLSGFDALTFWAKGTRGGTINEIGFGQDFGENRYLVSTTFQLTTNWRQYTIPIPDAAKLTQETGLFWYAEGPENGEGYTFWVDNVQFERLGTIAQAQPRIFNGNDVVQQTFNQANVTLSGLTQTFNMASGINQTVNAAPAYFVFKSSNPSVATVNEFGVVSVLSAGTAIITGNIGGTLNQTANEFEGGVNALGSLTLTSLGDFTPAPTPDRAPENVISIFSDAYTNVPVDYYNGFFAPFQTTQGQDDLNINGDNIINYTELNFVGIGTFLNVAPVNATGMTHFHVDINVQEAIDSGDFIRLELLNGVQTSNEISGSTTIASSELISNGWASFDIPLGEFSGLSVRDALGLIFFVSDATISNIYVDNIYYYKEVVDPSDNVDDSAATQVALPIGFESATLTYDIGVFAGADSAVETNPDQSGINPTSTVLRTTKSGGAEFFAGTTLELDAPVDFSTSQTFRMKVWSPKANIPVRIKLENSANSTQFVELDANTTTTNEWEELEWDFSSTNFNIAPLDRAVIFFEFVPGVSGDGSVYYCDDLKILE